MHIARKNNPVSNDKYIDIDNRERSKKCGIYDSPTLIDPESKTHRGGDSPQQKYQDLSTLIKNLCQASGLNPTYLHHVFGEIIGEVPEIQCKDSHSLNGMGSTPASELISQDGSGIGSSIYPVDVEPAFKVSNDIDSNESFGAVSKCSSSVNTTQHVDISDNSCVISGKILSESDVAYTSTLPDSSVIHNLESSLENADWWFESTFGSSFQSPKPKNTIRPSPPQTPLLASLPGSLPVDSLEPLDSLAPLSPMIDFYSNMDGFHSCSMSPIPMTLTQFDMDDVFEGLGNTKLNERFVTNLGSLAEANRERFVDELLSGGMFGGESDNVPGSIEKSGSNSFPNEEAGQIDVQNSMNFSGIAFESPADFVQVPALPQISDAVVNHKVFQVSSVQQELSGVESLKAPEETFVFQTPKTESRGRKRKTKSVAEPGTKTSKRRTEEISHTVRVLHFSPDAKMEVSNGYHTILPNQTFSPSGSFYNTTLSHINNLRSNEHQEEKRSTNGPQAMAAKVRRDKMNSRLKILQSIVPGAMDMTTEGFLLHTMSFIELLQDNIKNSMEKNHSEVSVKEGLTKYGCLASKGLVLCSVPKLQGLVNY